MPIIHEIEEGEGFMDTIAKYAHKLTRLLPSSDDTAREGWEDERHGVLKLKNGKYGRANYMGPNTHLVERVKRGDPPRTAMDELSRAHDIRYTNAKTQQDIARADEIFIAGAKKIQQNHLDHDINIQLGLRPIQAKYLYEKARNPTYIPETQPNEHDQTLLDRVLRDAISKGYGVMCGGRLIDVNNNAYNNIINDLNENEIEYYDIPIDAMEHFINSMRHMVVRNNENAIMIDYEEYENHQDILDIIRTILEGHRLRNRCNPNNIKPHNNRRPPRPPPQHIY